MSAAEHLPDTTFPDRLLSPLINYHLAMDVALGVEEDTILEAYNLQHHELQVIKKSAIFQQQLKRVSEQLEKDGGAFKMKAQAQAEALLIESFRLATDPDMDPKVRADMVKANVRWAGYDNPQGEGNGAAGGFAVHMHFHRDDEPTSITYDQEGNPQ